MTQLIANATPTDIPKNMDVRYVNAFLKGTMETLKIQASYPVKAQKSFYLTDDHKIESDICGVIGLTSSVFSGAITLCFSQKIFLAVMSSMFGESFSEITDELSDGAGELINIIFGQAKTVLTNEGLAVEKAIPTIIRGKDLKLSSLTGGGTTIVVPFEGKDGEFHVLIALGKQKNESLKIVK